MIYYIPFENFEDFEKKIFKLKNKAEKYQNAFEYRNEGIVLHKVDGLDNPVPFHKVFVEGIVSVTGWEYVGKITKLATNNNLVKSISDDFEVPEYFNHCEITCEHCHKKISRKNGFIVRNKETNEVKLVGKSCLEDYAGINAELLAFMSQFEKLCKLKEASHEYPIHRCFEVQKLVNVVAFVCKNNNNTYIKETSCKHRYTTLQTACSIYNVLYRGKYYGEYLDELSNKFNRSFKNETEFYNDIMNKVLEFAHSEESSENVKIIFESEFAPFDFMNEVADVVFKFFTDVEVIEAEKARQIEEENKKYEYYGNEGDKFEIVADTLRRVCGYSKTVPGYWDTVFVVVWNFTAKIDGKEHSFTWFSSGSPVVNFEHKDGEVFRNVKIKGTIKKHNLYNGKKDNIVTRCRCTFPEEYTNRKRLF